MLKSLFLMIAVGWMFGSTQPAESTNNNNLMNEQSTSQKQLKVGDKAPNWELKGSDGKTYKLSDYKNKQAVIVVWYPAALTGG